MGKSVENDRRSSSISSDGKSGEAGGIHLILCACIHTPKCTYTYPKRVSSSQVTLFHQCRSTLMLIEQFLVFKAIEGIHHLSSLYISQPFPQ